MISQRPDSDIATPEIRDALARVEGSRLFANSKRLTELLRFVVEAHLRGDTEGLKQTAIGIDLYGRDPSYDPKLDGIVRTHARRLRERLIEYYGSEGAHDPLVIELPRGRYVPAFQRREPSTGETEQAGRPAGVRHIAGDLDLDFLEATDAGNQPQQPTSSSTPTLYAWLHEIHREVGKFHILGVPLLVLVPVFLLAIVLAAAWAWNRAGIGRPAVSSAHRVPRVAVLHFRSAARGAENELFGRALADSVVASLARMNEVSVVEPPESSTGPTVEGTDAQIAIALKADYVVAGRFDKTKKLSKLYVSLTDEGSRTVIWSRDYSFPWANMVEIEDAMAAAVSQSLTQRVKATN